MKLYDNGGKSFDRYTLVLAFDVFGFSENALMPDGFSQYLGKPEEFPPEVLGKIIRAGDAPKQVQELIKSIISELYGE